MNKTTLKVIIPVYNEADIIVSVINEWLEALSQIEIPSYIISVYNDGSTDNSKDILDTQFGNHPHVNLHHKKNSGHGPTILEGYNEALETSDWVFQVDGDNEIHADHFNEFWKNREQYHFIIGYRIERHSPLFRQIMTLISRITVGLFYKRGIKDVNCPYRLFNSATYKQAIHSIPHDTFAPNLILSGIASLNPALIRQVPVPYSFRKTGTVSIKHFKLLKISLLAFWQTIVFRFSMKG